uniref:Uncharacterized protein n=1 Tax=Setaria viridis TaxID=4556 RepID=A0A4U6T577_SETVI|nr:hypothetical protein SEVIR_9G457000v2 [Setaria viridis]
MPMRRRWLSVSAAAGSARSSGREHASVLGGLIWWAGGTARHRTPCSLHVARPILLASDRDLGRGNPARLRGRRTPQVGGRVRFVARRRTAPGSPAPPSGM